MLNSMTAFATRTGSHGPFTWTWEVRSVNGKGLDLRLRLPDWVEGLEPAFRAALGSALTRGNVQASLKITRAESDGVAAIDADALGRVLTQLRDIETAAAQASVTLAPSRAVDLLTLRAVTDGAALDDGGPELANALKDDIAPLIESFTAMRATEGAALQQVIGAQIDGIAQLVAEAKALLPDRAAAQATAFRAGLERVMAEADIDENKLAQELAQLVIKSDVMEEIDRLEAHVVAAREMLNSGAPTGRKMDFLMQEFNREANTLCAKSGDATLTRIGLDLKVAIDQTREQVQNVE